MIVGAAFWHTFYMIVINYFYDLWRQRMSHLLTLMLMLVTIFLNKLSESCNVVWCFSGKLWRIDARLWLHYRTWAERHVQLLVSIALSACVVRYVICTVYVTRCCALARPVLLCCVYPSVCPSGLYILSKRIKRIFSPEGSHTIPVFPY